MGKNCLDIAHFVPPDPPGQEELWSAWGDFWGADPRRWLFIAIGPESDAWYLLDLEEADRYDGPLYRLPFDASTPERVADTLREVTTYQVSQITYGDKLA